MNRSLSFLYILFIIFILCTCFCFMPVYLSYSNISHHNFISYDSNLDFIWPIPDSTTITSNYGKRISPTAGASSFHKGIDIAAPENTPLYAICDGTITFANFLGGGGYTVTLSHDNMKITYCHVSPTFLVSVGDEVLKGELIAKVGPKNVYDVPNNPYKDKNGNPTNGATTGCHLHIGIRIDGKYINPLEILSIPEH